MIKLRKSGIFLSATAAKSECFRAKLGKKEMEDLLASTSIFLTRNYFLESGPKIASFWFYSLYSIL